MTKHFNSRFDMIILILNIFLGSVETLKDQRVLLGFQSFRQIYSYFGFSLFLRKEKDFVFLLNYIEVGIL